MLKNATPKQLAFFAAITTGLCFLVFGGIILFFFETNISWIYLPILSLMTSGLAFLIFFFVLKIYIYRKIKLVYKNIHKLKLNSDEKSGSTDINMNEDIISQVQSEVKNWAEGQEREMEKLKAMENYRRNFVGNVSHELKTPIFTVQGYIHTLIEGGIYDEKINMAFLKKAARGVNRLQSIVEELDTITKLESGQLVLNISEFSIKELAEEVIEELQIFAEEKNIKLAFKTGADLNFIVEADRIRIYQVLVNLVMNSIKYGKEKGYTKVSFYDMDFNILVEVSDDGLGIEKEHIPHLFDRFYRVEKSRSRNQGGSGLGLSIVKHILEAHRQTINVRSSKEVGSTFGFTLKKVLK